MTLAYSKTKEANSKPRINLNHNISIKRGSFKEYNYHLTFITSRVFDAFIFLGVP